jgi:hypothetical protein
MATHKSECDRQVLCLENFKPTPQMVTNLLRLSLVTDSHHLFTTPKVIEFGLPRC